MKIFPPKNDRKKVKFFFRLFSTFWQSVCFILVPKVYLIYDGVRIIMTSHWRNNYYVTKTLRNLSLKFRPICTSPTSAILNRSGSLDIILRIILRNVLRNHYVINCKYLKSMNFHDFHFRPCHMTQNMAGCYVICMTHAYDSLWDIFSFNGAYHLDFKSGNHGRSVSGPPLVRGLIIWLALHILRNRIEILSFICAI